MGYGETLNKMYHLDEGMDGTCESVLNNILDNVKKFVHMKKKTMENSISLEVSSS